MIGLVSLPSPVPRYRVNGLMLTKKELATLSTPTNIILQYFKTHRAFLKELGKHMTIAAAEEFVRHLIDSLLD